MRVGARPVLREQAARRDSNVKGRTANQRNRNVSAVNELGDFRQLPFANIVNSVTLRDAKGLDTFGDRQGGCFVVHEISNCGHMAIIAVFVTERRVTLFRVVLHQSTLTTCESMAKRITRRLTALNRFVIRTILFGIGRPLNNSTVQCDAYPPRGDTNVNLARRAVRLLHPFRTTNRNDVVAFHEVTSFNRPRKGSLQFNFTRQFGNEVFPNREVRVTISNNGSKGINSFEVRIRGITRVVFATRSGTRGNEPLNVLTGSGPNFKVNLSRLKAWIVRGRQSRHDNAKGPRT